MQNTKGGFITLLAILFAICGISIASNPTMDHKIHTLLHDSHSPTLATMHMHHMGGWMFGASIGYMAMKGLREGTNNTSLDTILMPTGNYMSGPVDMSMRMFMLHGMYTFKKNTTAMVMLPYKKLRMQIQNMAGRHVNVASDGLGDINLIVNRVFFQNDEYRLGGGIGFSLPTGSINKKDNTPMGFTLLGYPMQLGSGSFDISPQLIFDIQDHKDAWKLTTQLKAVYRTAKNKHQYRLGNNESCSIALTKLFSPSFSGVIRLEGEHQGNISGQDPNINPIMSPMANPAAQARTMALAYLGFTVAPQGSLKGQRLSFEAGKPFCEKFTGPQLKRSWVGKLAWTIMI